MNDNRRHNEFNATGFYLVAFCAACIFAWRDLLIMFQGEYVILRLVFAAIIFQKLSQPFDTIILYTHQYLTERLGLFRGVVVTMIILAGTVHSSVAVSSRAQAEGRRAFERQRAEKSYGYVTPYNKLAQISTTL